MNYDAAKRILESLSPTRARVLLEEAAYVRELATSRDPIFHEEIGLVQDRLVDPIVDALGFTPEYRDPGNPSVNQYYLVSGGRRVAYVFVHALGVSDRRGDLGLASGLAEVARDIRGRIGYDGPIIMTDGYTWRIYHTSGDMAVLAFTMENPEHLRELFALGLANHEPEEPAEGGAEG